jgi:membrane fusion protein, multidrug efflux system
MHIRKKQIVVALTVVAALLAAGIGFVHSSGRSAPQKAPAAPPVVSVIASRSADVPIEFTAQGHLVSLNQVDVRPQITGTIVGVHFKEGDDVRAGQLLFTLDASDATAQLKKSQALAAQIAAQLADAQREYKRSAELVKSEFIAPSAVETVASKVDSLQAQLHAANADIDSARLALAHTRIVAPISAKAGAILVHPGSLAQVSATAALVSLSQFDPIGVEFSLPEQDLNAILAARAASAVNVAIDGADGARITGTLSFINNTVSADTATINLKASLPNPGKRLWPGSYTRVTVSAGTSKGATLLPPQAVQEGPQGRFVYLVGADGKVSQQAVTLVRMHNDMVVVDGLPAGKAVVTEGAANLHPGMQARAVEVALPDPVQASTAGTIDGAAR